MFLYNLFLKKPIEKLDFQYAKKPQKIPTVFTHEEAMSVIDCMVTPYKLMAQIIYSAGLIQTLMGHTDIRTTEIYLHVLDELGNKVKTLSTNSCYGEINPSNSCSRK